MLETDVKTNIPDQEKYYKILAEFGFNQQAERHFKNWCVIRAVERETLESWHDDGFLDKKQDSKSGVILYSCPDRYRNLCNRIEEYARDNYSGVREFHSKFNDEDIERLRDYTLDLVSL